MVDLAGREVDAVKVPLGHARGESSSERLRHLKAEFAGMLRAESVTVFNQGTYYFIAKDPAQTLQLPFGHRRYGQPRYDWIFQDGGVELGYLVDEAR